MLIISVMAIVTAMPIHAATADKTKLQNQRTNVTQISQIQRDLPSNTPNVNITEFVTTFSNGTISKDTVIETTVQNTDFLATSLLSGYTTKKFMKSYVMFKQIRA
ncbi:MULTISPECIES: hypothetical protein [Caproicibacterium]|uniref:Uncharacterized protein n=1 Tax=Caproicibacterium argilliputei TaxID=3030016 RepID=A0AA97D8U0_9FIRM|nr:hypothetical protein [Caproicibacterium argilliputei]WOC31165.1 hypothetical protein PXC00_07980 [Caproicibacterium argilliputei]